ncbi:MAG: N-6 DNA methylase [Acidimicrobiales bacterium]
MAEVEPPPGGWADPWLIGAVHELTASTGERALRGAWYTPRPVVEELVQRALTAGTDAVLGDSLVIDPTCGGGGFLLAALDRLVVLGSSPDQALARIGSLDIDPGAVRATHAAVAAWGRLAGASDQAISGAVERICLGDQLVGWPDDWPSVSVVIGNPPFATPLRGGSFPGAARRRRSDVIASAPTPTWRRSTWPSVSSGSLRADGCASCCHSRCLAGVTPPDSEAGSTTLRQSSISGRRPRPCSMPPCECGRPCARRGGEANAIVVVRGCRLRARCSPVTVAAPGRLGELLSSATAGFRDEFYALAEACVELADVSSTGLLPDGFVRVATVGSLDPPRVGGVDGPRPSPNGAGMPRSSTVRRCPAAPSRGSSNSANPKCCCRPSRRSSSRSSTGTARWRR